MTKRFKCEMYANILAFTELEVEADTVEEARQEAIKDANRLKVHDWNLESVEDVDLNCPPYEIEEPVEDEQK